MQNLWILSLLDSRWHGTLKYQTTERLISTKMHNAKHIFGIVALTCYICIDFTYAAFPLERDVAKFTKILPNKKWTVFMEREVSSCFTEIKRNDSNSLIDAVRCMTEKQHTSKCVYFSWLSCRLNHIRPHILMYKFWDSNPRIRFIVHRQFSINITVFGLPNPAQISFEGMGKVYFYRGPVYPFTFMHPDNIITLRYQSQVSYGVTFIEYDVVQRFNVTHFQHIGETTIYFRWGSSLVICFHIQIDKTHRLSLDVTSCLHCKFLVYDGPNERLPIIMNPNSAVKAQKVVASTFQVFLIVIESQQQQETLTYASVYKHGAAFNFSNVEHLKFNFDNGTYCKGHSMVSRQCVYAFHTNNLETIRFSLTEFQLTGDYQGAGFAAGIVLFNYFLGKREVMFELTKHFETSKIRYVDLTGTGSKMDVVVFVYSVFASLSVTFVMTTTRCNTLLVHNSFVSYTRYLTPVDHTRRAFEIKTSAQEVIQSNACFRIQLLSFRYLFHFSFPQSIPALVTTMPSLETHRWECGIFLISPHYFWIGNTQSKIRTIASIQVNCTDRSSDLQTVEIKWLPCKIPCTCLQPRLCPRSELIVHPNATNTCDICQFVHIYSNWVRLKPNSSLNIRMKSNTCPFVALKFRDDNEDGFRSPTFEIALNRSSIISRTPDFKSSMMITMLPTKCPFEIPLAAIPPSSASAAIYGGGVSSTKFTRHMVKAAYWRGTLYRRFSRANPVSWDTAAKSCKQAGQFLLTIHSVDEYHFIKETFMQPHDTSVVYVGMKREVMYLHKVYISLLNPLAYII